MGGAASSRRGASDGQAAAAGKQIAEDDHLATLLEDYNTNRVTKQPAEADKEQVNVKLHALQSHLDQGERDQDRLKALMQQQLLKRPEIVDKTQFIDVKQHRGTSEDSDAVHPSSPTSSTTHPRVDLRPPTPIEPSREAPKPKQIQKHKRLAGRRASVIDESDLQGMPPFILVNVSHIAIR
jgi:hypothetical protein